jgi:acetate kinase
MVSDGRLRILTLNAGSSSLKAALYDMDRTERLMLAVVYQRAALTDPRTWSRPTTEHSILNTDY